MQNIPESPSLQRIQLQEIGGDVLAGFVNTGRNPSSEKIREIRGMPVSRPRRCDQPEARHPGIRPSGQRYHSCLEQGRTFHILSPDLLISQQKDISLKISGTIRGQHNLDAG